MHGLQIAFVTPNKFEIVSQEGEAGIGVIAKINSRKVESSAYSQLMKTTFYVRGVYDHLDFHDVNVREDFTSRDLIDVVSELNEMPPSRVVINSWNYVGNKWSHNVNSF